MKIKRQLHIFIIFVVLIPLIAFTTVPINKQFSGGNIDSEKLIVISMMIAALLELICIILYFTFPMQFQNQLHFYREPRKELQTEKFQNRSNAEKTVVAKMKLQT